MQQAVHQTIREEHKRLVSKPDQVLPSGSVIHWSEENNEFVPVTCGRCNHKRLVKQVTIKGNYLGRGKQCNGWCSDCRHRKYFDNQTLDNGSIIHWLERQRKRIPVTCGKCGKKRLVFDGKCGEPTFTGLCHECGVNKRTSDEGHHSGAIIHWAERQGNHTQGNLKIAFTCSQCSEKNFSSPLIFKYPHWRGLCPNCIRFRGGLKKYSQDEMLTSGTIIHFGTPDPNNHKNVLVTCVCGDTRSISRSVALLLHREQQSRTGYCEEHSRNSGAVYTLLMNRAQQCELESNSQKINVGTEKRGPGRPLEDRTHEHEQLKVRYENVILKLGRELPQHKIKRPAIAAEYASRGERIDLSTVTKRVQLLYGEDISVADAVALVLSKNRENNSDN
jgi:hypothetical protein